MIQLELRDQGDGTAMLNYWDYRGGNDICLRLFPDGTAQELFFPDDPEDETEIWKPANLVARLLAMAASS